MADSVGDAVCRAEPFFRILLAVVVFLGLLFLVSLPTIEPGTPEYYISLANVVILGTGLALSLGLIYYCKQREKARPGE